jgi:hypothetical protein
MSERRDDYSELAYAEAMVMAQTELSIRYTVPFEWGTIRVTEAAHEAYSFTPLREGVQQGDIDSEDRPGYIDVRLVGPDEIPESSQKESRGLHIFTLLHEERLGVQAGFSQRTAESPESARSLLQGTVGVDDEEFAEMMADFESPSEDLPAELAMSQQMSQLLIHSLSEAIPRPIIKAYSDIERSESNRKALKHATVSGGIVLGAAGGGALIVGPVMGLNVAGEIILGAYATTGFWIARRGMKAYLDGASEREQKVAAEAEVLAQLVSNGIHETYCLAHFDYENQQRLQSED